MRAFSAVQATSANCVVMRSTTTGPCASICCTTVVTCASFCIDIALCVLDCVVELDEELGCVAVVLLVLAPTLPVVLPVLEVPG
jgi:hypothetical protein